MIHSVLSYIRHTSLCHSNNSLGLAHYTCHTLDSYYNHAHVKSCTLPAAKLLGLHWHLSLPSGSRASSQNPLYLPLLVFCDWQPTCLEVVITHLFDHTTSLMKRTRGTIDCLILETSRGPPSPSMQSLLARNCIYVYSGSFEYVHMNFINMSHQRL